MVTVIVAAVLSGSCGGGDTGGGGSASAGKGGEERTVLVDYHHDEFASAFLQYYPSKVQVRPGDTVHFKQAWSGEPHSVTMGKVVDDVFEVAPLVEQYDGPEEARAAGLSEELIQRAVDTYAKLPGMVGEGYTIFQPGARPCFVADLADVPAFTDIEKQQPIPGATCPTEGRPQPAFRGGEGLYNSGFISPTGPSANEFDVPIAADATPGTYRYFCNYHWTGMSGSIEIVAPGAPIPSQAAVNKQAREQINRAATQAVARVRAARQGKFGGITPPLAGRASADDDESDESPANYVAINEFFPRKTEAKVDEPVTWTVDGFAHTISFNVPKYFPIFTVKGPEHDVEWNPQSFKPVGWDIPTRQRTNEEGGPPPPTVVDVGKWDGKGGFHSSGALEHGDRFSVTFTRPGTYSYACVLHPQMVGTVVVRA